MTKKIPARYRKLLFAVLMSLTTSMLVSAVILWRHGVTAQAFPGLWWQAFTTAWPVVLIAILLIAPRLDRLLNQLVEPA